MHLVQTLVTSAEFCARGAVSRKDAVNFNVIRGKTVLKKYVLRL